MRTRSGLFVALGDGDPEGGVLLGDLAQISKSSAGSGIVGSKLSEVGQRVSSRRWSGRRRWWWRSIADGLWLRSGV